LGVLQVKIFGGRKTFCKKFSFPRTPILSKNLKEGSKRMFCFAKYLSQSPFSQKVFEE